MRTIHIFELASVGLFGYRAISMFRRSAEVQADADVLPIGPERRLMTNAANALQTDAWINSFFAIGLAGLTAASWDRPWTHFDILDKHL